MAIEYTYFSRITNFTGRNGLMKCSGIEIMPISNDRVILSPLTSKGIVGRCDIFIPVEDIPKLIQTLQNYAVQQEVLRK